MQQMTSRSAEMASITSRRAPRWAPLSLMPLMPLMTSVALIVAGCGGSAEDEEVAEMPEAAPVHEQAQGLDIKMSTNRVDLVGRYGDHVTPSSVIYFNMSGGSGRYYAQIVPDHPELMKASFEITRSDAARLQFKLRSRTLQYQAGSIGLKLCRDAACSVVVWQRTVPYRAAIVDLKADSVALHAYESETVTRSVRIVPSAAAPLFKLGSISRRSGWLSARRNGDQLDFTATAKQLRPGTFKEDVLMTLAGYEYDEGRWIVPVRFTVGAGLVAPADQSLQWTATSTTANTTLSVPIDFRGALKPTWKVTSDADWLVPVKGSGTGDGSAHFRVDATQFAALANGTRAVAHVTVSPTGVLPKTFDVTLTKRVPELTGIWPDAVTAGQAGAVRVRGLGLSQLGSGTSLKLGGKTVSSVEVVNDGEAIVSLPALKPGAYALSVTNAAHLPVPDVPLASVSRVEPIAASIHETGPKSGLVVDAAHHAVYTVSRQRTGLLRFQRDAEGWKRSVLVIPDAGAVGWSTDRRSLYVSSGLRTIVEVDVASFTIVARHRAPQSFGAAPFRQTHLLGPQANLPVTADGRLWFAKNDHDKGPMSFLDLKSKQYLPFHFPSAYLISDLDGAGLYAPADGSFMFMLQQWRSPPQSPLRYRTATRKVTLLSDWAHGNLDTLNMGGGRYAVANDHLPLDLGTGRALGQFPDLNTIRASAVSADGKLIYVVRSDDSELGAPAWLEVLDSTRWKPGTDQLRSRGRIAVPEAMKQCEVNIWLNGCVAALGVSRDGDEVYWIDEKRFVVVPLPDKLRPAASRSTATAAEDDADDGAGPARLLPAR